MAAGAPRAILVLYMGAPYESDLLATLLRLVEAALDRGHRLVVWTCGGATTVTQRTLGPAKPRNPLAVAQRYPSTARLVKALVDKGAGRLRWYVCRQCLEERGAVEQMAEVTVKAPFHFLPCLDEADVCLSVGVK